MEERLAGTDNGGFELSDVPENQLHDGNGDVSSSSAAALLQHENQNERKGKNEADVRRGKHLKFDRYGFVIGEFEEKNGTKEGQTWTAVEESTTAITILEQPLQSQLDDTNGNRINIYSSESSKVFLTFLKKWAPNISTPRIESAVSEQSAPLIQQHQEEPLSIQKRRGADIPQNEAQRRLTLERLREQKWERMLQKWSKYHNSKTKRNSTKLKRRIRKGIPNILRGRAWLMLADVPTMMGKNPTRYEELVWSKDIPSQDTRDVIERDIHRTFPRHALFLEEKYSDLSGESCGVGEDQTNLAVRLMKVDEYANRVFNCGNSTNDVTEETNTGLDNEEDDILHAKGGQASLRRVLRAYSLYDIDVGYCQGMNFIAATLITFMEEEEAFWMLVAVMNEQPTKIRGLFGEGMHQTQQILDTSEKLIRDFLPVLHKHFEKENIHITMFVTQWMLTVFTSSFPFDLVVRVWDCFLAEGYKIVYRVMLALLQISTPDLLKLPFEEILAYLQRLPSKVDGHQVMEAAFSIKLKRKQIAKYEQQYYSQRPKVY